MNQSNKLAGGLLPVQIITHMLVSECNKLLSLIAGCLEKQGNLKQVTSSDCSDSIEPRKFGQKKNQIKKIK